MAPARKDDDIRVGNDGYCKVYLKKAFRTESVIHAVHENIEKRIPLPGIYTVMPCMPREKHSGDHLDSVVGNVEITHSFELSCGQCEQIWGPHTFEYGITDLQALPNTREKKRKVPCIRSIRIHLFMI